ncbi:TIGR00282 family metallophosphoesterase [Enterococcus timonensis]|uniref:TIGR00282 family metallophosphoesterase n=1 Tax=Enterococcus timonensis TaxID=1852364 RepID=UPI0008DAE615|nr:TIGR00282 family metallophosphoesterase [Enterococcus timonensis]
MRILFVGDVMGSLGRTMISNYLPKLKQKYRPQMTIVNGENAASGRGITEKIYKKLLQDGADLITMGNHTWDNREIFTFIDSANKMVRPANFPAGTPGVGLRIVQVNAEKLAVINLQGRALMNPLDDPFTKADELVAQAQKETSNIFVDFHAETTSEKQAMGWYLDGRVSAVCGTHTHVQTNDARILPKGTGYLTDVGMTGPFNGILGMKKEAVIDKFITSLPHRFEVVEEGDGLLCGAVLDLTLDGQCKKIQAFQVSPDHPFMD